MNHDNLRWRCKSTVKEESVMGAERVGIHLQEGRPQQAWQKTQPPGMYSQGRRKGSESQGISEIEAEERKFTRAGERA